MAEPRSRRWTDRAGREWEVAYNPGVELDTRRDRITREALLFRSGEVEVRAPAPYGSGFHALSDADLQGLLDSALREGGAEGGWKGAEPDEG